jgi:hypothetical protein
VPGAQTRDFLGETAPERCFGGSFWVEMALYGEAANGYNARKGTLQELASCLIAL